MSSLSYISDKSEIANDAIVGEDTRIWSYSKLQKGCRVGSRCVIGSYVEIGPGVEIGDDCKIQNNVSIYKGVRLEDKVFCGPSMVFTNVLNPRAFVERKEDFAETLVREGATIGANATIVCGVEIGKYSMIGAGSVVTKNVADYALMVGVPAKQIGWMCKCGEVLSKPVFSQETIEIGCHRCHSEYKHHIDKYIPLKENL